jgi:L-iditol 2-dehydrogenase
VTFDSTEYCGECEECQSGFVNLCPNRKVLGVSPGEYRRHGCFAEQIALPQRILYRIPDELSYEKAAFAEPVSIALHAVNLADGIEVGEAFTEPEEHEDDHAERITAPRAAPARGKKRAARRSSSARA